MFLLLLIAGILCLTLGTASWVITVGYVLTVIGGVVVALGLLAFLGVASFARRQL